MRDVYSIGVLLLQALHAEKIRDFADVGPAVEAVHVPPRVRQLLKSCVDPDRTQRPANASVLLAEFEYATNAAVSSARRKPIVHLALTETARQQLSNELNLDSAAKITVAVTGDLAAEVFAEFRMDRERGKADRDTIMLIGNSCRLTTKVSKDRACLVVVGARVHDFETLESMRRRSLALTGIVEWSCAPIRTSSAAAAALEQLLRALDDHEESRHNRGQNQAHHAASDDIFESWLRLLQAREEVARGDRKPLRYSTNRRRRREADFTLSTETDLDLVGTEMEVVIEESGKWIARGEVVAQGGGELTIRSPREFPRLPTRGLLTPFLGPSQIAIQRQRDAISAIQDGTAERADLASLILDPRKIKPPRDTVVAEWHSQLDDSKKAAVRAALGSQDLVVVQGPPGTGKTTFITEVAAQLLQQNPAGRLLIVSQTHVAVDNALERLDNAGLANIVRLGARDDSLVDARVRHLLLDQQMGRWANTLRHKAEDHLGAQAKEAGIPADHLRAALALQQLVSVSEAMEAAERNIRDTLENQRVQPADGDGLSSISSLQERLNRLTEHRADLLHEAQTHLAGDLTLNSDLSRADAEAAVEALIGKTGTGPALLRLLSLQAEWLQRVASDENLASSFLQTSNVIAGTCIGFLRHQAVRDLQIDLCILDEASKAAATEALVPMAKARQWILIGDTSQLPPMDEDVLRRPELLEEYDLDPEFVKETLFSRFVNEAPRSLPLQAA